MGFCVCSMFCCALLCVLSSFAIILMEKRERESLLLYFICILMPCDSYCYVALLMVPWVGVKCVIVIFPYHTHLLFLY